MALTQTSDLTSGYRSFDRVELTYRPVASTVYTPGLAVQVSAMDAQIYPDMKTVGLAGTGANQQMLAGIVAETWPGFNPIAATPSYTAPANLSAMRGTVGISVVRKGFHPGVLVDQSGTGAVTVVNGLALIASRGTAGYLQGGSASAPAGGSAVVANAVLPASGIGSSITAAALAQASQTATLTGTPAAGDTLSVTIQTPYVSTAAGTAQTTTWTTPGLTTAQAVSVTTAAVALAAYLNAQPDFSKYFTATSSAGVVTVTVNANAVLFRVNGGSGTNVTWFFDIAISGMVANSLTFAVAATGGTTNTAGAANLASGTGYKGPLPAIVCAA